MKTLERCKAEFLHS
uniref:Uncharacterized protein n=1 Tax=Anguilla anguilla TaxID=7936 RepID=A0A0E9VBR2_ANGAN